MVERLAARARRVDEHPQIGLGLLLTDEFGQRLGAQRLVGGFVRNRLAGNQSRQRPSSWSAALISAASPAASPSRRDA